MILFPFEFAHRHASGIYKKIGNQLTTDQKLHVTSVR